MLSPSEEVTKTWVYSKGIMLKRRPPSRFSFVVCLAIVFSIAFGFLGGFITAGFTLNENYSTVYENLITELETTRQCLEREKKKLQAERQVMKPLASNATVSHANAKILALNQPSTHVRDQAIFSVFSHAIELFQKNDKSGGCAELNNIINLPRVYNGEWKNKAQYLLNKNCH